MTSKRQAITDTPQAGKVALAFFFALMEKWGCSPSEQKVLLGSVGNTTYQKYRSLPEVRLSHDLMERISHLMGIHKSLRIIFSNQADNTYQWVKKPNQAAPFNGRSALQFMLSGRITELSDVRRYLDRVHSPTWDATNYAFDSEHVARSRPYLLSLTSLAEGMPSAKDGASSQKMHCVDNCYTVI